LDGAVRLLNVDKDMTDPSFIGIDLLLDQLKNEGLYDEFLGNAKEHIEALSGELNEKNIRLYALTLILKEHQVRNILSLLSLIIPDHIDTLIRKQKELLSIDDYGVIDKRRWLNEILKFLRSVGRRDINNLSDEFTKEEFHQFTNRIIDHVDSILEGDSPRSSD
jgi:hypothetical protein